jgi:hypothetical protein
MGNRTSPSPTHEPEFKETDWHQAKTLGSDHYKTDGIEPVDLLRSGCMFFDFALGNIIKYAFRCREESERDRKLMISDMNKIIDYATKLKAILNEGG